MKQSRAVKLLSVFVSIVLVFGLTPAAALAEVPPDQQDPLGPLAPGGSALLEVQEEADPNTIVDSFGTPIDGKYVLEDGKTYKLTKDFELGSYCIKVPSSATVTIDLGGFTLRRTVNKETDDAVIGTSGTLTVKNGTITGGWASYGGILNTGTLDLEGVTVTGNKAYWYGGGMYVNVRSNAFTMQDVAVSGNTATNAGGGAALKSGTMQVSRSLFVGNTSPDGGGVYVTEDTKLVARDTQFSKNLVTKLSGGGFVNSFGTVELTDCTISGNEVHDTGGGIYTSGKTTLTNCTVSGNNAFNNGGGVMVNNKGS